MTIESIVAAWSNMHVCVIGDVMIDEYIYGSVSRMSPEAPVPVVDVERIDRRLGGAANVALNCKRLGAKVTIASVVGIDDYANTLHNLLTAEDIDANLIQNSKFRKTTCKQRIISKHQQMLRVDFETKEALNTPDEHAFIDAVMRYLQIQKPDVVIFEDYNKGVLKKNVLDKLLTHCTLLQIPTAVDPKKHNFFEYIGVTIFKPNLKEINEAFELQIAPQKEALQQIHEQLFQKLRHQHTLITLSEHGIFTTDGEHTAMYPSHERKIADVSGAGDTVIAVASMTYIASDDMALAAKWSNIAGGLVCEEIGVVPISLEKLLTEVSKNDV